MHVLRGAYIGVFALRAELIHTALERPRTPQTTCFAVSGDFLSFTRRGDVFFARRPEGRSKKNCTGREHSCRTIFLSFAVHRGAIFGVENEKIQ